MSNVQEVVPSSDSDQSDRPTTGDAETDVEVLKSVPAGFAIDCEEHANWLVKKVVAARQYCERVKQWAEQEQRRALREEQTLMFLFGRQIEAWTRSEISKLRGRRKSINLPAGSIGFRAYTAKLVIDDEKEVLSWAKMNCPHAVVVTEYLSKSVVSDLLKSTGALPDSGAHVEPEGERFFIK